MTMDEAGEVTAPFVVSLPREIDMTNAESVLHDLVAACRPGIRVVIGDLTSTTFCDSAGLRSLALASRRAAEAEVELRLAVPPAGAVQRVLEITDLVAVLVLYPSVEAAAAGAGRAS